AQRSRWGAVTVAPNSTPGGGWPLSGPGSPPGETGAGCRQSRQKEGSPQKSAAEGPKCRKPAADGRGLSSVILQPAFRNRRSQRLLGRSISISERLTSRGSSSSEAES